MEEERKARYAKEGEVSILRKTIEKVLSASSILYLGTHSTQTTKDHAAEVARIKAAREAAEASQAQLRKEMSEERERLRTEYMFKVVTSPVSLCRKICITIPAATRT